MDFTPLNLFLNSSSYHSGTSFLSAAFKSLMQLFDFSITLSWSFILVELQKHNIMNRATQLNLYGVENPIVLGSTTAMLYARKFKLPKRDGDFFRLFCCTIFVRSRSFGDGSYRRNNGFGDT